MNNNHLSWFGHPDHLPMSEDYHFYLGLPHEQVNVFVIVLHLPDMPQVTGLLEI